MKTENKLHSRNASKKYQVYPKLKKRLKTTALFRWVILPLLVARPIFNLTIQEKKTFVNNRYRPFFPKLPSGKGCEIFFLKFKFSE